MAQRAVRPCRIDRRDTTSFRLRQYIHKCIAEERAALDRHSMQMNERQWLPGSGAPEQRNELPPLYSHLIPLG